VNRLKLSADRKVSPRAWQQPGGVRPGRWIPTIRNSFGLPSGFSCPGRTPFCESCYASNSERSAGVLAAMLHNARLLTEAETVTGMTGLLGEMIGRYEREADRVDLPASDRMFRIHWDGDFFSVDYAQAWANVIVRHPGVSFWTYTRSFTEDVNVVPVLYNIPNLSLYLSVDDWNSQRAFEILVDYSDVHLALCGVDYRTAQNLFFPQRPMNSVVCPENSGKMPLTSPQGRGACVDCRVCPDGRRDVVFSTSHREVAVAVRR
jgi:hypothetical protein